MMKLDKPLYHGTSAASAKRITYWGETFDTPLYLTAHRDAAIHYAQCATAYLERAAKKEGAKLLASGYAVFTFNSLPNKDWLVKDDYHEDAEPGQFKYLKPIRTMKHYTVAYYPFEYDEEKHLHLVSFAIGMWSR